MSSETNEKLHRVRSNSYDRAMSSGIQPTTTTSPRPQLQLQRDDDDFHYVKWIDFQGEKLPILLQNANGPCPLLAIGNVLLLSKRVNRRFENIFR